MSNSARGDLVSELSKLVKGDVVGEQNSAYQEEVKLAWNGCLHNKKPLMFVKVASENDILETLKFSKKNKLSLCVSNGGTSIFAQDDGAVVIKLAKLNNVTVDPDSKMVMVQCGATQGDVDQTTTKYNLATTLGQASYVGATGSGLMLGMGLLGRTCGYEMDNIQSIEMITASGESLTTSATQNEELFWAMKGFGANFGIVTKLCLTLYPIPAQVMAGNLYFSWDKAAETLKVMRNFLEEKNDNRLVLYWVISTEKERGKLVLFIRYFFNGECEKGLVILDEFCKRSSPCSCDVKSTSYVAFQRSEDSLNPFGNYYQEGGFFLKELSDECINNLVERYNKLPSIEEMSGSVCYVIPAGGAYSEVPQNSSPFLFREARYRITNLPSTKNPHFQCKIKTWLDETCKELSVFAMEKDKSKEDEIWNRLRQIKYLYDPENIFKYNINIDSAKI